VPHPKYRNAQPAADRQDKAPGSEGDDARGHSSWDKTSKHIPERGTPYPNDCSERRQAARPYRHQPLMLGRVWRRYRSAAVGGVRVLPHEVGYIRNVPVISPLFPGPC
jgi:hypothetical protein